MDDEKLIKEILETSLLSVPSEDFNEKVLASLEKRKASSTKVYLSVDDHQIIIITLLSILTVLFLLATEELRNGILVGFLSLIFIGFVSVANILTKRALASS
ncbi:hypothetical protein [Niabella sp.]|uniref:hypothetical protein n=1 Tax=Niabella sp. TaxID=1962976 RepID=UPI00261A5D6A|nr:hypothetical protein [Niabella sp.]